MVAVALVLFGATAATARDIQIVNPMTDWDAADPAVLRHGDTLYMVSTGYGRDGGWYPIRTSPNDDRSTWTFVGSVFPRTVSPAWATGRSGFWAPELHKVGDRFICYFSARNDERRFCVGAATASHPAGPYMPLPEPLVSKPGMGLIDASYFQDPQTSRSYLLWKEDGNDLRPQIPTDLVIQELEADGTTLIAQPKAILKNDAPWEDVLVEAPSIIYHDGYYYLFFSGNVFSADGYNTGVARARTVTGPYEKYASNPILRHTSRFSGPGHQFLYQEAPGLWTLFYHARDTTRTYRPDMRLLMSDPIKWTRDGWPQINDGTPSTTWTLTLP